MIFASVKHDLLANALKFKKAGKQLPFGIAKGLTATAKDAQAALGKALPENLDRPTPFTMKAFGVEPATKQKQYAKVFIKDDQEKYLQYQVAGGTRTPARRAVVVPKGVRLNQYGNMTRGAIKKLLARKDVFSGKVKGVAGIYQRKGTHVHLIVSYADRVQYKKRFPFGDIGQAAVKASSAKNLIAAIDAALASAR
jgi:hypothetical protein